MLKACDLDDAAMTQEHNTTRLQSLWQLTCFAHYAQDIRDGEDAIRDLEGYVPRRFCQN